MMGKHTPSDEQINAFVDDELAPVERARLLERISDEAELRQQACELRMLKDMVRAGYREPPGRRPSRPLHQGGWGQRAMAASLLLALGLGLGWMTRGALDTPGALQFATLQRVAADPARLVLHVDTGTPERFASLLDQTQTLLEEARRDGRPLQVAVVANSGGIDLLRAATAPQAERIRALQAAYPNLSFIGCRQTLGRLKDNGQDTRLLPGVQLAPAAVDAIVERLQSGWTYIKA